MHYFIEDVVPVRNQFIRMDDERYRIRDILLSAPSITAGMADWVKHCQSIHSDLIWEYCQSIDYEDLVKSLLDYLGKLIENLNRLLSKGVHAEVTLSEVNRAVIYTYLTVVEVLECYTTNLT